MRGQFHNLHLNLVIDVGDLNELYFQEICSHNGNILFFIWTSRRQIYKAIFQDFFLKCHFIYTLIQGRKDVFNIKVFKLKYNL